MASIDDILARKKPHERSLNVLLDPETGERADFTFRALPRHDWALLIEAHPPPDEQQAEYVQRQLDMGIPQHRVERLQYDADTFPPALLAAACVEPEMTADQATALWESERFSDAELERMLNVAMLVNRSAEGTVGWGKGSPETPTSGTSSTPPRPIGSRSRSSSNGAKPTRTRQSPTKPG